MPLFDSPTRLRHDPPHSSPSEHVRDRIAEPGEVEGGREATRETYEMDLSSPLQSATLMVARVSTDDRQEERLYLGQDSGEMAAKGSE